MDFAAALAARQVPLAAVACAQPAASLASQLMSPNDLASPGVVVVDCQSDPHASWTACGVPVSPTPPGTVDMPGTCRDAPEEWLPRLLAALPAGRPVGLIVDDLVPWTRSHGLAPLLALLDNLLQSRRLCALVAGAGSLPPRQVSALRAAARMIVEAHPTPEPEALCEVRCSSARPRMGPRVSAAAAFPSLLPSGLRFQLCTPVGAASSTATGETVRSVRPGVVGAPAPTGMPVAAGGMSLQLSKEEALARSAVQLPYEHQGQAASQASDDFRLSLPAAAGGLHAARNHILYDRDSESDADSDEDPDDDIDI